MGFRKCLIHEIFLTFFIATSIATPGFKLSDFEDYFECDRVCAERVCEPVPDDCRSPMVEPTVCKCCVVCARELGEECAFYENVCRHDLKCVHQPVRSVSYLERLTTATGICMAPRRGRYTTIR